MCPAFAFLLTAYVASWLRLSRLADTWKAAGILILHGLRLSARTWWATRRQIWPAAAAQAQHGPGRGRPTAGQESTRSARSSGRPSRADGPRVTYVQKKRIALDRLTVHLDPVHQGGRSRWPFRTISGPSVSCAAGTGVRAAAPRRAGVMPDLVVSSSAGALNAVAFASDPTQSAWSG